jgi:hypothetical protein
MILLDRIICGEVFYNILSHDVATSVRVPAPALQNGLLPPRAGITGRLSTHPTGLMPLTTQQAVQEKVRRCCNSLLRKQSAHASLHGAQR